MGRDVGKKEGREEEKGNEVRKKGKADQRNMA